MKIKIKIIFSIIRVHFVTQSVPKVFELSSYGHMSGVIYINKVALSLLKFRSQIL